MTARKLDGKATARTIRDELRAEVARLTARGSRPGLGVVLVGDDPASAVYVRSKTAGLRGARDAPRDARASPRPPPPRTWPRSSAELQPRRDIHGILVQLPLPPQVDATRVLDLVDPAKDVDGFHADNVGRLVQKRPRFVPCTPAGIMELLARHEIAGRGAARGGGRPQRHRGQADGAAPHARRRHGDRVPLAHRATCAAVSPGGGRPGGRDRSAPGLGARRARQARGGGGRRGHEPGGGPGRGAGAARSRAPRRASRSSGYALVGRRPRPVGAARWPGP